MTGKDTTGQTQAVHETCWEILPWYVNGSLPEDERQHVEHHLAVCAHCRREVMSLQRFQDHLLEYDAGVQQQEAAFSRLMQHIKKTDAEAPDSTNRSKARVDLKAWLATLRGLFERTNTIYAVTGVILVGIILGVLLTHQTDRKMYTTLSTTQADKEGRLFIHVIFKPQTSELEIRELLQRYHASVIGGPDPVGIYTLSIDKHSLTIQQQQSVLADLRQHPVIAWVSALPDGRGEFPP